MLLHIFLSSTFLSKPSCGHGPCRPLCLVFKGFFLNILYSIHSFLLGPPTGTKLTGPGNSVKAFPVPWRVILQMQVPFLLPILNLNHLFQEAFSDRPWPTLILPLLCVSSELNTFPAFTLGRAICYIRSLDKHLLRVHTMCQAFIVHLLCNQHCARHRTCSALKELLLMLITFRPFPGRPST